MSCSTRSSAPVSTIVRCSDAICAASSVGSPISSSTIRRAGGASRSRAYAMSTVRLPSRRSSPEGLPVTRFVAEDAEHVIAQLERHADRMPERRQRGLLRGVGAGERRADRERLLDAVARRLERRDAQRALGVPLVGLGDVRRLLGDVEELADRHLAAHRRVLGARRRRVGGRMPRPVPLRGGRRSRPRAGRRAGLRPTGRRPRRRRPTRARGERPRARDARRGGRGACRSCRSRRRARARRRGRPRARRRRRRPSGGGAGAVRAASSTALHPAMQNRPRRRFPPSRARRSGLDEQPRFGPEIGRRGSLGREEVVQTLGNRFDGIRRG